MQQECFVYSLITLSYEKIICNLYICYNPYYKKYDYIRIIRAQACTQTRIRITRK